MTKNFVLKDPANKQLFLESNGGVPVNIQDQTSQTIDDFMCQSITGPYILSADTVPDSYTIDLVSAAGLTVGDTIGLFKNSTDPQSYFGVIQSISTNTLTMDTPLPVVFPSSDSVLFEVLCDLSVDGSSTRQIFTLTNNSSVSLDVTRIIIQMDTATTPQFDEFGDLPALTNGCIFRLALSDGTFQNIGNWKSNQDMAAYMYDLDLLSAFFGANGVKGRMTFAGQDKHGVTLRIRENEELQFIIQDDLTGLNEFRIMVQGHFVTD